MITAGIDVGAKTIKVLLLCDGEVAGRGMKAAGFEAKEIAVEVLEQALAEAGVKRSEITSVAATGVGRDGAPDKDLVLTEESAAARGVGSLYPEARTVIDVGAEAARAIRCDEGARAGDVAVNEKCAAGVGAFTEAMARALEVPIEELGALSLESTRTLPMNTQCVVFAESEQVGPLSLSVVEEPPPVSSNCVVFANSEATDLLRQGAPRRPTRTWTIRCGVTDGASCLRRVRAGHRTNWCRVA